MKWYGLCHLGAESATVSELSRLQVDAKARVGAVEFEADKKQAARVLYYSQCITRLLAAVDDGPYTELDFSHAHSLISDDETFRVVVDVIAGAPTQDTSVDLAAEFGTHIDRDVDLDHADKDVFVQVGSESFAGVDVFGDLSKRYYRIFTNARSVKGTLAASMLELYPPQGGLLDPFGNTGEVAIEAALRAAHISPRKYEKHKPALLLEDEQEEWSDDPKDQSFKIWCYDDQLGNLRSCKKNGKLAGVSDVIQFSKIDPEWMDVKFHENDLTMIATIPPPVTKRNPSDDHIEELCYQAEYVLKDSKGLLVVCCLTEETTKAVAKHAKTYKLELQSEHIIYSGQLGHHIVCYGL